MTEPEKKIEEIGLFPVLAPTTAAHAELLAGILCDGGMPAGEVTFRTPYAAEVIRRMTAARPDMTVGAGTVLTPAQVDEAAAAGAAFVVAPGFDERVVARCREKGIPVMPGCATPSDLARAYTMGLSTVKFFPAEAAGGVRALRAMAAPYGMMRFVPTGGISPDNIASYLACPAVLGCGGSFIIREKDYAAGDADAMRATVAAAVRAMFDFRLLHLGINAGCEAEAAAAVRVLSLLFGQPVREEKNAYFYGDWFEVMRRGGRGKNGHIGILTNCLPRAVAYCRRLGFHFEEDSAGYDAAGNLRILYMTEEILGFALHLTARA